MAETKTKKSKSVKGADLVPDMAASAPGVTREYYYWVGVFPSCPVDNLTVAGVAFPKVNEDLVPQAGTTELQRVPHVGGITRLTADKLELIRDRVSQTVLRFRDARAEDEPMAGVGLSQHFRARRGHPIRIPSAKAIREAEKSGRTLPRYVAGAHDEPAARYMFAHLCEDQENPRPGGVYPPSLEDAGLHWPEKE